MELPWERHFVWLKTSRKCHRNAAEYAVHRAEKRRSVQSARAAANRTSNNK